MTADAEVVWSDAALDAVLLQADRALLGVGLTVVRWGELTCEYPAARPVCTMTGFPRAMRRSLPDSPNIFVSDPKTVDGHIKPNSGSRSGLYSFEVDDASPASVELWHGLSGAGVFCQDTVVGLATLASQHWQGRMLMVMPATRLLAAAGFTETFTTATGMPPQLQSADLSMLFADAPDPQMSSSYLLNPRSQVVPLTGMTRHLDALEAWCRTSRSTDVTVIAGMGGIGKTRLVTELLHRLTQPHPDNHALRPWTGGFLVDTPLQQPPHYGMFAATTYPLLIAIDYAETRRSQVDQVLNALAARRDGSPVRVLLLARARDNWWPSVCRSWRGTRVMSTSASIDIDWADALHGTDEEGAVADAKHAFAERIQLLQNAGLGDDWATSPLQTAPDIDSGFVPAAQPEGDTLISLHIAALADVLAALDADFARHENPMDVLIAHEMRYWRRIVEARGEFFDEALMRTMVAVQVLAGAKRRGDAQAAVAVSFDVHHRGFPNTAPHDARLLAAYEDILTAAYPSGSGARWGAMGPDLLSAALITEVERDSDHQFIEHLLAHPYLEMDQQHRSLTVIARASTTHPDLAAAATRAVAAAPEKLLPLAAKTIAAQLSPEAARSWLLGLQDAITKEAQRPDADSDIYAWATGTVSAALTFLETGIGGRPPNADGPGNNDPEQDVEEDGDPNTTKSGDGPGAPPPTAPAGSADALATHQSAVTASAAVQMAQQTALAGTITGRGGSAMRSTSARGGDNAPGLGTPGSDIPGPIPSGPQRPILAQAATSAAPSGGGTPSAGFPVGRSGDGAEARREGNRLRFVGAATRRIARGIDLDEIVLGLCRASVPTFSDAILVYLRDPLPVGDERPVAPFVLRLRRSDRLRLSEEETESSAEPERLLPPTLAGLTPAAELCKVWARGPLAEVLRGVRPVFGHSSAALSELLGVGRTVPLVHRAILAPLRGRRRVIGAAVFLRGTERPPFEANDLLVAAQLATHTALSIDKAVLYGREAYIADELQRTMLPDSLPQPTGVRLASRYLPAAETARVGGDWYDAIPLPGSRVALVVGDVMGRSMTSAAVMGQLRSMLKALAALDLPPQEVLHHLDELARDLGSDRMATCMYAVYDPVAHRITIANAGHPPPVLLHPGGNAEVLRVPPGAPIGVGGVDFEAVELDAPAGATLLLYTDGLVESRLRDVWTGIEQLRERLATTAQLTSPDHPPPLEALCDDVLGMLGPGDRDDDIALLAARFDGIAQPDVA